MFVLSAVLIYLVWAMYLQSDMVSVEDAEVVIVGGGISGLSAAVALQVKIHLAFGLHCFSPSKDPSCFGIALFWFCRRRQVSKLSYWRLGKGLVVGSALYRWENNCDQCEKLLIGWRWGFIGTGGAVDPWR